MLPIADFCEPHCSNGDVLMIVLVVVALLVLIAALKGRF